MVAAFGSADNEDRGLASLGLKSQHMAKKAASGL